MPCTLPLEELAGVFMSPWASTQIRPMRPPSAPRELGRRRDRTGRQAVISSEHQGQRPLFQRPTRAW